MRLKEKIKKTRENIFQVFGARAVEAWKNSRLFFLFFISTPLFSQDIHYSQFYNSPLNLNPANTGMFDGDFRFAANQRTQWRSVTVPFSTFSLSADAFQPKEWKNISLGALMNHDIEGDSRFRTFDFNLTGAYFINPGGDSTQKLNFGMLMGVTNKHIDYSQLNFDNQFDGFIYNQNLGNGESFQRESRTYMNLQLGATYYKLLGKRKYIIGGISLANITKPRQSYFDVRTISLDRRFNLHASANIPLNDKIEIAPSILTQFQGTYQEIVLGSNLRYILLNEKGVYRAVLGGIYYRGKDAVYLKLGLDYDNWIAGVSYDFNVSDLNLASNYRGALEFSLIYILHHYHPKLIQHRICPNYI
jgi:type IX secretion system PorP/SprF family membrane protein